ncbi:MAG TPA: hypothetical protein VG826_34630 [Pirellulales bacterium]|nr:hypothetical protein [Pirellulales bacterium]
MPQKLLSSILIAAQLLSWSGSSLYLCLCGTTACVDFGPATCQCCGEQCEESHELCEDGGAGCQHHRDSGLAIAQDSEPCSCRHVQISVASLAVVVDVGIARLLSSQPLAATAPVVAIPILFESSGEWYTSRATVSPALDALSSVVLRC